MKHLIIFIITYTLFVACGSRQRNILPTSSTPVQKQQVKLPKKHTAPKKHAVKQSKLPPAPKKKHIPKAVEDNNYSDKYMYPEDSKAAKKDPVKEETTNSVSSIMTKEECIAMISQEKFDRYTAMFGNEAASIKRCAMIKAMKK